MALAVPLSRFASQVGGGSAFFVRPLAHAMKGTNNLIGGIVMCVFPTMIFFLPHGDLPVWVVVLLALFILCGVWAIISSIFRLDADSAWSWVVGAIVAIGFAGFAFLLAWQETDFRGGIPFIPAAWNSVVARILFAFGGLLGWFQRLFSCGKAIKNFRSL